MHTVLRLSRPQQSVPASLQAFSALNDGNVRSNDPTYLTARAGATFLVNTIGQNSTFGQELFSGNYYGYESFFEFDTSSIPDNADIVSAVLSVYHNSKAGIFEARARLYDFGSTVTSADWVPGANLAALTLLAHIASGSITTGAYNNWLSDALASNINKGGVTRMVMCTNGLENATVPTAQDYTNVEMADHAGTTFDPYLTVTYSTVV